MGYCSKVCGHFTLQSNNIPTMCILFHFHVEKRSPRSKKKLLFLGFAIFNKRKERKWEELHPRNEEILVVLQGCTGKGGRVWFSLNHIVTMVH